MKKIFVIAIATLSLVSCTENERARRFGGVEEVELKPNEDFELNPVMSAKIEQMGELVITSDSKKRIEGLTTIDPVIIRMIPGANAQSLAFIAKAISLVWAELFDLVNR